MTDIGREFMLKTQYRFLSPSQEKQGVPQPPLELPYLPTAKLIDLPEPNEIHVPDVNLRTVIEQRRTLRRYADLHLSLTELSFLLWATQGVKRVTERRTVPSAGARHAFETILMVNRVEGLQPGLYRYIALEHALLELSAPPEIQHTLYQACLDQSQITSSAVTFFWVAVVERMYWRYGERGYRYLHLDAGHVCQNLCLAAEGIGGGVCEIAAYEDDAVNAALGLDGVEQFVIYLATVGKKS
jgi:SagB-type dehydrogenase family enzyme